MCGIFGYVGAGKDNPSLVVDGLRRLEYRGYDSWGVAALNGGKTVHTLKRTGKISRTSDADLASLPAASPVAVGHTRWATHGVPSETNAHPHLSPDHRLAVVHNGIIENHRELRNLLEAEGYVFRSQTDTEVVVYLLHRNLANSSTFVEALSKTLLSLRGAFGLAIIDAEQPGRLYVVRLGSPLVVGIDTGRYFVSSDANALLPHTQQVIFLQDGQWALLEPAGVQTFDFRCAATKNVVEEVTASLAATELGGHPHYMHKEIHDQPDSIRDTLAGRIVRGEATVELAGLADLPMPQRVTILACGSSWHAGLIGRHYLEELAGLPTTVEYASEFRYRRAVVEPNTLVIAISQSGETADTLAGLRESMRRGASALGLVNVVGSTIARECGRGVYLHAGPEFGVAATKSFTNQLVVLLLLAVHLGRRRGMSLRQGLELLRALEDLPAHAERAIATEQQIREIALEYTAADNFLYIGRGLEFPIALEGALKLKEVSYIHAEGLPAAELKHGPIALIDERMPTVVIATQGFLMDKVASNVQEIKARGGRIIAVVTQGESRLDDLADHRIEVPETNDLVSPILATIPTQWLAYQLAVLRGCDVDQPRNLAKSVTVE